MLTVALEEMFYGANTGLYLCGTLTVGAATCIATHGSEAQKALYLPKLYSGEWAGAMALTEAHAGTDLGIMRARGTGRDGSYRSAAQKSSSRTATTISPRTASIWCLRSCRMRRTARAAFRCSWCRSSSSTPMGH
jgi:alkylation response protein AidB-like acyl-CoA dehydrogenase